MTFVICYEETSDRIEKMCTYLIRWYLKRATIKEGSGLLNVKDFKTKGSKILRL